MVRIKYNINLDNLFGNVYHNVTGEPVTPRKVAAFYLIRQLFRMHHGYRAVPSVKPFTAREKTRIYTVLFGLIMLEYDLPYDDFRKAVRLLDKEVRRGIYYYFVVSMEKLASGEEFVDIRVEDSLWTGKREYHECASYDPPATKPLMFMNTKCYVFIWMKRIIAEWTKSTQNNKYQVNSNMRDWLNKNWKCIAADTTGDMMNLIPKYIGSGIPHEFDCSIRARAWIIRNIQVIQMAPSKALNYDLCLNFCELIKKRHPDVYTANLLAAVCHVQKQNSPLAIKAIKRFFDLCMFKMNDNVVNASQTHRMAISCQRPLRYAPLLQGRVCRLLGDFRTAHTLFTEAVQQSQLTMDETCNRMANIELTTMKIIQSGPLLETPHTSETVELEKDKRIVQQNIHRGAELDEHTHIEAFYTDPEESFELHEQLISMAKQLYVLEDIRNSKYCIKSSEIVETGLRVTVCSDHAQKTRKVDDTSMALATSNLLKNGMFKHAKRAAKSMLTCNFQAPWFLAHETEAFAIAAVNLAYASASLGDYDKAFRVIDKLERIYVKEVNWVAARHVKICHLLISFERSFLDSYTIGCENVLRSLNSIAPLEAVLRRGLLLASVGKATEAIRELTEYKCSDVLGCMRIQMQLATIYTSCGMLEKAEHELELCSKTSMNTTLRHIRPLIARRAANVLMARKEYTKAVKLLTIVATDMERFGSSIECCLFNFTMARCIRYSERDPVLYLAKARLLAVNCKWSSMDKLIMAETTKHYESVRQIGEYEQRDAALEIFEELDNMSSISVNNLWLLV